MNDLLNGILEALLNSPLLLALSVAYAVVWSIDIYDTRLIQAKTKGFYSGVALEAEGRQLPNWVGFIPVAKWILLVAILILDWKYGLVLYALLFLLRVLPVLERVGSLIMHPFLLKEPGEKDLEYELTRTIAEHVHSLGVEGKQGGCVQPFHVWVGSPAIQELNIEEALDKYIDMYDLVQPSKPDEPVAISRDIAKLRALGELDELRDGLTPDGQDLLDSYVLRLRSCLAVDLKRWQIDQKRDALDRRLADTDPGAESSQET